MSPGVVESPLGKARTSVAEGMSRKTLFSASIPSLSVSRRLTTPVSPVASCTAATIGVKSCSNACGVAFSSSSNSFRSLAAILLSGLLVV